MKLLSATRPRIRDEPRLPDAPLSVLGDLGPSPCNRVLAAVDRVQQDLREHAGELAALVALTGGRLALILNRLCGGAFDVLDRGAVAVDQLIAAFEEHLLDENQQQRVPARGRYSQPIQPA